MTQPWPPAERPTAGAMQRRREVVRATRAGREDLVVAHLDDPDDRVRASAVLGLAALDALDAKGEAAALADPSHRVRRALAQAGASCPGVDLATLLDDDDPSVCEVACWAAGERGVASRHHLGALRTIAVDHADSLCREAAIAALGAIGAEEALPTILAAMSDRPTVRRRAVIALAPFDTPEVTTALEKALEDRDWQVRQAAEDLLAR